MFRESLSTDLSADRTHNMNVFYYYYSVEENRVGGMSTESFPREAADKRERSARLARLLKDFRDGGRGGVGEIGKKKSRLEQGAEKIQTEKLCPREAEFIVCPRSISPASTPFFPCRLVHFGLVGNILTISFSYLYPSYYEVRITRAVYVPGTPGP